MLAYFLHPLFRSHLAGHIRWLAANLASTLLLKVQSEGKHMPSDAQTLLGAMIGLLTNCGGGRS